MDVKKILIYFLIGIVILLPYLGFVFLLKWYNNKVDEIDNAAFIVISKEEMQLSLYDYAGNLKKNYPIACGKNMGNKRVVGDMKTPEGIFHISSVEDASSWTHDFKDGKGEIDGCYGNWFLRLSVPNQSGIGIHGTHDPNSIGSRVTEGCIRLNNSDLEELKQLVYIGMTVIIIPSYLDVSNNKLPDAK